MGSHRAESELANWMSYVPSNYNLTRMTIPGTHDSHAIKANVVRDENFKPATTQWLPIKRQLELGVRCIDLRLGNGERVGDGWYLRHGEAGLRGKFDDVLGDVKNFLEIHKSETVLIFVLFDHPRHTPDYDIAKGVADRWAQNGWYSGNMWPDLGEVRGKAVLLRRFQANPYLGIDMMEYYSKQESDSKLPARWHQQDVQKDNAGLSYEDRWDHAWRHLSVACQDPYDRVMYFTGLADSKLIFFRWPKDYGYNMNRRLRRHFAQTWNDTDPINHRYGVIVGDFFLYPDILKIIDKNYLQRIFKAGDLERRGNDTDPIAAWPGTEREIAIYFQRDGNLVVKDKTNTVMWAADCGGRTQDDNKLLKFQKDGHLVITDNGTEIWPGKNGPAWDSSTRLVMMNGPPYLLIDRSSGDGEVFWTPAGAGLLGEPDYGEI